MTQSALIYRFATQQALHWSITGLIVPVLILLFQTRGLNLTEIGIVMALWIGTTALLEVPLGSFADQFGRVRTYRLSLLMTILGAALMLQASNLILVMVSAVLLGAARAIYSGTLDAWFYDQFQSIEGEASYHSALAKINIMVTFGLALGSLIGGWLPDSGLVHFSWMQSIYDINLLVIITASVALLIVTQWLVPIELSKVQSKPEPRPSNLLTKGRQALRLSWHHSVLKPVMQTTLVLGMVLSCVENLWQPYLSELLSERDSGTQVFGLISALYFLMAALSSWLSVRVLSWFSGSHRMLILVSRVASAGVLFGLALTTQLESFAIVYLLFFFLFTLGENSQSVLLQDSTPSDMRSTMLSISSLMVTVGGMGASLGFGYLADHFGIGVSWSIAAILLMASSMLFALIPAEKAKRGHSLV
ncbi:MFS transporter [Vibrio europaeus]|uniref:MFS transporter n=1 Tax=Vibrio europaeus TaxID=300876 RepID=UPI00233E75A0|nr:MFS transporter [Vibrio europaeus]MDC5856572.1 MFS transporter [Vibrio europaeus]